MREKEMTPAVNKTRRQNGRIARLPEDVRLKINQMIYDGVFYYEILARLGPAVAHVSKGNLVKWKKGTGYRRWEQERAQARQLHDRAVLAIQLAKENEGVVIQKASLDIAASQFLELLKDLDVNGLRGILEEDPQEYARIISTMVRLAEGSLKFERYRAEVAEKKELLLKQLAEAKKEGGMSRKSIREMEQTLRLL